MATSVRLSVGDVISNGISLGLKNLVSLILLAILYVITIWIPYLNIGTTIGLWDQIVRMGRGEKINPTAIFDERYRKRIGDFFLLLTLSAAGSIAGLILPGAGYIISLAWMLAIPLYVDRGTDTMTSLSLSNELTYGNKLTVFLSLFAFVAIVGILVMIIFFALQDVPVLAFLLIFVIYLLVFPAILGMYSYIYNRLVSGLDASEASAEAVTL